MSRFFVLVFCSVVGAHVGLSQAADNWPQWRGPLGTGVAAGAEYPIRFSAKEGTAWKISLPGPGASTPAVWGERIFVTCGVDASHDQPAAGNDDRAKRLDSVVCYNMQGKEVWRRQFGPERPGRNPNATGSNPSPVTDGEHLVVYYKSGTLACLDLGGNEKWKMNLQDRFGKDTLWWDLGTSPVIADGRVIVAVMQTGDSYLAAFDLKTGNIAWRTPRQYTCTIESDQSYTTPQVIRLNGKNQIVTWGADHLTGHDAATGKLLWECGDFNPNEQPNLRTIASAAVDGNIAVVPYLRGDALAGIGLNGSGDITKSARIWEKHTRKGSADVPTPIVANGKAILLTDSGHIDCLDMKSGNVLWSVDLPRNRNRFYASPVLAGDILYCARLDGVVLVGRVSDKGFELLSENNDMGERILATPVPVRGGILIRGDEHMFWIASNRMAR
jgi:outer membrane protein assembly factor BamB